MFEDEKIMRMRKCGELAAIARDSALVEAAFGAIELQANSFT